MHSKQDFILIGVLALAISSFGLTGCEKETEPENHAPEIVSISASADSISQGGTVTLIAVVTDEDGDAIELEWSAPKGTFNETDNDTVVWTAPEVQEIVTITLEAHDSVNIVSSTIDIGVEVYVPSVQPYYVGASTCQGCHSSTYTNWSGTHHAEAQLDYGSSYCLACHTTGYDTEVANGGYDENPVSKLENVQCESCHGPASAHVASQSADDITKTLSEEACQQCHGSTHTTFWADWAGSGHGTVLDGYPGAGRSGCSQCHSGNGFVDYTNGLSAATYDTTIAVDINCVTCHDPHSGANEHQIRKADAVTMPGGAVVSEGGLGLLCLNCHTGRRSADDILDHLINGSRHFGPHHGNQGAFLVPDVYVADVAPTGFHWSSTDHINIEDACVTCHMEGEEGVNTGHAFEPSVEACEPCHGILTSFNDIVAKNDFDGDSTVEGLQSEVNGLIDLLTAALVTAGLDTTGGEDIQGALGDTLRSTLVMRQAGFNLLAVEFDHSYGVHNAAFTVQLLQQSYKHVTGFDVPNGYMLMPGER